MDPCDGARGPEHAILRFLHTCVANISAVFMEDEGSSPSQTLPCIHISPRTPLPRLPVHQTHALENPLLRFFHALSPGTFPPDITMVLIKPFEINNLPIPPISHPRTIKLPPFHILRIPPQIPLKRRARTPTQDRAPYSPPGGNDDIDTAVDVGVLCFGVSSQIGILGWPIRVLPDYESFVQGVEAVPAATGAEG